VVHCTPCMAKTAASTSSAVHSRAAMTTPLRLRGYEALGEYRRGLAVTVAPSA
jgi:hypothetical protein